MTPSLALIVYCSSKPGYLGLDDPPDYFLVTVEADVMIGSQLSRICSDPEKVGNDASRSEAEAATQRCLDGLAGKLAAIGISQADVSRQVSVQKERWNEKRRRLMKRHGDAA